MHAAKAGSTRRPPPGPRHFRRRGWRWGRHASVLLVVAFLNLTGGCPRPAPGLKLPWRVFRVGYLPSPPPASPASVEGFQHFRQRLQEPGYREGENPAIEYRVSDGKEERYHDLAAE